MTFHATGTPILHVEASFISAERGLRRLILSRTSLKHYIHFSFILKLTIFIYKQLKRHGAFSAVHSNGQRTNFCSCANTLLSVHPKHNEEAFKLACINQQTHNKLQAFADTCVGVCVLFPIKKLSHALSTATNGELCASVDYLQVHPTSDVTFKTKKKGKEVQTWPPKHKDLLLHKQPFTPFFTSSESFHQCHIIILKLRANSVIDVP